MAARIRVGIIYENNENWVGGAYYIQNLIAAINTLPDSQKPHLTILAQKELDFIEIKKLNYPYASYELLQYNRGKLNLALRIINKCSNYLTKFDLYPQPIQIIGKHFDVVFPSPVGLLKEGDQRNFYWIPDFQEQFLPQFFSKEEIRNRTQSHQFIAQSGGDVVFSSEDAHSTFNKLFPDSKVSKHILQFAVTHPSSYKELDLLALTKKYRLDKPYFFAPNQFWKHKNQITVLKAVKLLQQKGINDFIVAFSGKEFDYRNPDYVNNLKSFIKENNLGENVRLLGFIDRDEQLKLMSGAIAIIQPSLFEGWSTVVEDAKAMDQWIIASNLDVHKEQLSQNASFFNAENSNELADILILGLNQGFTKKSFDYTSRINQFGADFLKLLVN